MLGVLVQIDAYDPVAAAAVTLYASSVDDPAVCHLNGQTWWPAIAQLPTLAYDLFDGGFGGAITTPASNLVLVVEPWPNLPRYMLADARLRLWTGNVGDAWASWTQRFDGRVKAQPTIVDGLANIGFAVDDRWLDAPLLTTYAGTTGAEGQAALKGTAKPLALGAPRYVEGVIVDPANNVFQVSGYGLIEDIEVALERLARFGASAGDYASYAALVAASIPPGRWATSKAVGMVRFGAPPAGQISFLVRGDKAGPDGWARKPGQLIRRLALLAGGTGKIDDASLNALDVARPYNVSLYVGSQSSARELIQSIAASVNAVAGVSWMGKLFVAPVGIGTPSLTYQADGSALPPVAVVEQQEMAAPWWKLAIEAERTETVHSMGDVAFTAELIDMGAYVSTTTYREGNMVQNQNSSWLYINPTPTAGNAPPTLPTTSNAYWKVLAKAGDQGAQGPNGADTWRAIYDPTYYTDLGGGTFQRIMPTAWSGQYIRSNEKIIGGARASFTPQLSGEAAVGLHRTTTPTGSEWSSIDVSWHKTPTTMTAYNRLSGTLVGTSYPAAVADDIYEVVYRETSATAGIVEWLKNGAVVQSYVTTAGLGFYFFGTIASLNSRINFARFASLGAAGADGLSIAELTIYRRATSAPAVPTGGSYNFATGVLTPPSGWSATVPAGNDPCYAASGVAAIQGSSGTDTPDWLGVGLAFQEGAATNVVFRRSATQPATPAASSGTPASWYDSTGNVPAGADPIWASYGSRPNAGANWTWQTPKRVEGEDGANALVLTYGPGSKPIQCFSDGTVKSGQFDTFAVPTLLYGDVDVTQQASTSYTISVESGLTAGVSNVTATKGVVTLQGLTVEKAKATITATYGIFTAKAAVEAYKVRDGTSPAPAYPAEPCDLTTIVYSKPIVLDAGQTIGFNVNVRSNLAATGSGTVNGQIQYSLYGSGSWTVFPSGSGLSPTSSEGFGPGELPGAQCYSRITNAGPGSKTYQFRFVGSKTGTGSVFIDPGSYMQPALVS